MDTITTFIRDLVAGDSQRSGFSSRQSLVPIALAYPVLVALLRYRRIRKTEQEHYYPTRESYAKMTAAEAFEITRSYSELEFPAFYEKALQFALFRTYGIPSISKLLMKTAQLSTAKHAPKRYADTAVLVSEIWGQPPGSERSIEAFGRLNYLHGHYIRQGLISNEDLLYTLGMFLLEPIRWVDEFEWRKPTELELCAFGVQHKYIGDSMAISFDPLPSGKAGFRDGIQFVEEIKAWVEEYEKQYMVPDDNNHQTANETTAILLVPVPKSLHGPGRKAVSAVMDRRLRRAMKYDDPPRIYTILVQGILSFRKYFLRYLALPRPSFMRVTFVSDKADVEGRRTMQRYENFPFYVKPTLMNRWGPPSWSSRLMGLPLPGDEGYYPEGFKTPNVGPKVFEGKGKAEAEETKARLRREGLGGCPFMMRN